MSASLSDMAGFRDGGIAVTTRLGELQRRVATLPEISGAVLVCTVPGPQRVVLFSTSKVRDVVSMLGALDVARQHLLNAVVRPNADGE